jgi:hypothetical protein
MIADICAAAYTGKNEKVLECLDDGDDIETRGPISDRCVRFQNGDVDWTPLMFAIYGGQDHTVAMLIKLHANVSFVNMFGHTPLRMALVMGNSYVVDCLVACEAYRGSTMVTDICVAAYTGNNEKVLKCLQDGADIETHRPWLHFKSGGSDYTPLMFAIDGGHDHTVAMLIKLHANVSFVNMFSQTPLLMALARGNSYVVKCLIAGGVDLNHRGRYQLSPLQTACIERNKKRHESKTVDVNADQAIEELELGLQRAKDGTQLYSNFMSVPVDVGSQGRRDWDDGVMLNFDNCPEPPSVKRFVPGAPWFAARPQPVLAPHIYKYDRYKAYSIHE